MRREPSDLPTATGRYLLSAHEDGAVLLDLHSGTFFRLNRAAARLCQDWLGGRLSATDAERIQAQLAAEPPAVPANPITLDGDAEGFVLRWEGRPVWHLDAAGRRLRYLADAGALGADARTQLLWVAPYLLRLRGHRVLHASAVARGRKVVAFCGSSGTGKTTLAGLLAAHGWELIAEDLLVLDLGAEPPQAARDGETAIRRWAAQRSVGLRAALEISLEELDAVSNGPRFPLDRIVFPRRAGAEAIAIQEHRLGPTDGQLSLLENSFAELSRLWREVWAESERLVATVPIFCAEVPEGLDRLRAAAGRYGLS